MFKSYWTIAWRTLVRNKVYTLVNVLGLAMGVCACLVIWVIAQYEFSFDRGHPDGNRIYRINSYEQFLKNESKHLTPSVLTALPEAVRKNLAGVETVAPFHLLSGAVATVVGAGKTKTDYAAEPIITGPEYFRIMHYDWLVGDAAAALVAPFSVVLTEKKARQYFGTGPLEAMIGRRIVYNDSLPVNVTGIVRDWSEHTDFPYDQFISLSTAPHSWLYQALGLDPAGDRKSTFWTCKMPSRSTVRLFEKRIPIFTMHCCLLYYLLYPMQYVWDFIWSPGENNVYLAMAKNKKVTEKFEITTTSKLPGLKGIPVIVVS